MVTISKALSARAEVNWAAINKEKPVGMRVGLSSRRNSQVKQTAHWDWRP